MNRRGLILGAATAGLLRSPASGTVPSTPEPAEWEHPEWFAAPEAVAGRVRKPGHQIIALTPEEDFAAGHIPGAIQIDWSDLALVDSAEATVEDWTVDVSQLLAARGVAPNTSVTIYDGGTFYAARLWWVLEILGHATKSVLDGGLGAWTESGGALETGPSMQATDAPAYPANPDLRSLATIDAVEEAVESVNAILVDARDPSEYEAGHIPGAVNIPFLDNAVPGSGGMWKSPAELRAMYEASGITLERAVIPYCSTGVRSANTWFTLRALGYPDVRLFSGSFTEWTSDPSRPVE
jgi:thiosulfate/3-mercaptopyruvate sulfurtransferase